jgi:hypothetical protein
MWVQAAHLPPSPRLSRRRWQISTFDGVLECRSENWWAVEPGVLVRCAWAAASGPFSPSFASPATQCGSLHIRVRAGADEQEVLSFAHGCLRRHVAHLTIQIEKDPKWLFDS